MNRWLFIYLLCAALPQAAFGNIDLRPLTFPVGTAMGAALLAVLFVLEREQGNSRWMRAFRSPRMACRLLTLLTVGCLIGGCLPAGKSVSTSWPFVALLLALLAHLYLLLLHRLFRFAWKRDLTFLFVHGGLWLALLSGTLGAADTQELHILAPLATPTRMAADAYGRMTPLPHELKLQDFAVETHPADGSPVQYSASFLLDKKPVTLRVNHPYSLGWDKDLYLMSFGRQGETADTTYCVLQLVCQPWKYPLLAGLLLLLAGMVGLLARLK